MSILYLEIINLESQQSLGAYEHGELKNSPLKKEIEDKSKELMTQIKTETKSVKKHIHFKNDSKKSIEIYYLCTNSGTLYLAYIELTTENSKIFKDNYIYELLEDIDSQNIKKFVDEDDKLSNVGQQNLRMYIDKYHNNYNFDSGEGLIDDDPQTNKISIINSQINDVKNDMKQNVKNMMTNMQEMNEIEGKSVSIKDTSFQFQKDSKALENKMKRAALRNKILLFVAVATFLAIVIYIFLK
jgi:hypothetical protein